MKHAERALELTRATGDRAGILQAITNYSLAISAQGRVEDEIRMLEPAREEYHDIAETPEHVRLCAELARAYLLTGRGRDAVMLADETMPVAERLELTHEVLSILVTRGAALAGGGRITEAIATLTGAVESAKTYGFPDLELRGRVNLSFAAAGEDPQLGYRVVREGVEMSEHLGMRGYAFYLLGNAAEFAIHIGDWDWAYPRVQEAALLETDYAARMRFAELRGLRGEDVSAELDGLYALMSDMTEMQAPASVLEVKAAFALSRGDGAGALALAQQSYGLNISPDSAALLIASRAGRGSAIVPRSRRRSTA